MASTSELFDGEVTRAWTVPRVDRETPSAVVLYHDALSGLRSAMLDFEEIPGSLGTSSVLMADPDRIFFPIPGATATRQQQHPNQQQQQQQQQQHDSRTGNGNRHTVASACIEIAKDGFLGFTYTLSVDGQIIPENTMVGAGVAGTGAGGAVGGTGGVRYQTEVFAAAAARKSHDSIVTWYSVRTKRVSDGFSTTVHRRFRDFADLDEQVHAALKGHHLYDSLPLLPEKHLKFVIDHNDEEFVNERRIELNSYLQRMISIPHVASMASVQAFVGLLDKVKEMSFVFTEPTLGLSFVPCTRPDTPATVSFIQHADARPGLLVGDVVSKVNGIAVATLTFQGLIGMVKQLPRPIVLHFVQMASPSAQVRNVADSNSSGEESKAIPDATATGAATAAATTTSSSTSTMGNGSSSRSRYERPSYLPEDDDDDADAQATEYGYGAGPGTGVRRKKASSGPRDLPPSQQPYIHPGRRNENSKSSAGAQRTPDYLASPAMLSSPGLAGADSGFLYGGESNPGDAHTFSGQSSSAAPSQGPYPERSNIMGNLSPESQARAQQEQEQARLAKERENERMLEEARERQRQHEARFSRGPGYSAEGIGPGAVPPAPVQQQQQQAVHHHQQAYMSAAYPIPSATTYAEHSSPAGVSSSDADSPDPLQSHGHPRLVSGTAPRFAGTTANEQGGVFLGETEPDGL